MLERVFIVDEDVQVRDFFYELISDVGFGVLTVPTGNQLLELLKKERPALLIIADAPGEFSGFSLVKKIREFDKDIKIIVLGNENETPAQTNLIKETATTSYLTKDFRNSDTIKRILFVLCQESFFKPHSDKRWGRVLVVDDEYESRVSVGNFLSRRGFEVDTASSGEECLGKVKQAPFDIVLLDITLSGMDGLLALKHIMNINKEMKVVMVTALQNEKVLSQAKAMGAIDYIIKPFNFGTLEATLLSVVLVDKTAPKKDGPYN
jgi:DNA-binding response OmpR family regulator